jgi:hypothetical protein
VKGAEGRLQASIAKEDDPSNNVVWTSGWTHTSETWQVRLETAEATKIAADIEASGKYAKGMLQLLEKESTKGADGGDPRVTLADQGAVDVMDALAAKLGLSLKFQLNSQPAHAPMG